MSAIKLWTETVSDYYKSKGKTYKIPKKGSDDYNAIKKIYDKKRGNAKQKCKDCKKACCSCN